MNYKKIHNAIIGRANSRCLSKEIYTERHHITPRCMGGGNDKNNLVRLTAEEHFVVHQLLVKIFPNVPKLAFALRQLTRRSIGQIRNNKEYGWIKKKLSIVVSEQHKGTKRPAQAERMRGNKNAVGCKHGTAWYALQPAKMIGNKNSVGTSWITDGVSSKKIISGQLIPIGWRKGRIVNWSSRGQF